MLHEWGQRTGRTAVAAAIAVGWLAACSDPDPVRYAQRFVDSGLGEERGLSTGGSGTGGSATGGIGIGGNGPGGVGAGGDDGCPECREQPGPWSCQVALRSGSPFVSYCACGAAGECPSGLVCKGGALGARGICIVPCDFDAGACSTGTVCNPAKRYCTECVANTDCKRPGIHQCTPDGTCVQCSTDADCAGVVSGLRCIDNECGCHVSQDCVASGVRRRCGNSVLPNRCVECDDDQDCTDPARPMCERSLCRPACAADADCPATAPICLGVDGRCVECDDTIGPPCTDPAKPQCTWYLQCKGADEPYL